MALSLKEKLKQAAATRMAETAGDTNARLDGMDAKAGLSPAQVVPLKLRTETPAAYGDTSAPHPDTTSRQDNPAPQDDTTSQHLKTTPQPGISTPHVGTSAPHPDTAIRQDNPASQSITSTRHDKTAPQGSTASRHLKSAGQSGISASAQSVLHVCLDAPALVRTPAQKRLLRYLEEHGHHVSNYDKIIAETGLRYGTVRDVLNRFEKQGILSKKPWAQGSARGIQFTFHGLVRQDNSTPQHNTSFHQDIPTAQGNTASRHHIPAPQHDASFKKDRKEDLSISQDTLETAWPSLARAGFGTDQLAQIARSLAEQGKATDKVVQGLDHAEWELAAGRMLDKTGQPVADPCAWVFRSLASAGYYRRPAGYVSPAEQAERDAEDEARAVAERREKARQARFEAWVKGLPPQERKDALQGRMGPEKEWLKKVWIERGEPL